MSESLPSVENLPNPERKPAMDFKRQPDGVAEQNRTLPVALGPEKSVLSSCFQDSVQFIGRAIEIGISEDHFYYPQHKILWKLLQERYNDALPVDLVSLTQILTDRKLLDAVGGAGGLAEIYAYSASHAHFDYHVQLLRDKFLLRSVIDSCSDAITRAYDQEIDVTNFLDQVEQEILAIRERNEKVKEQTIRSLLQKVTEQAASLFLNSGKDSIPLAGISSGYSDLDKMSNGLKGGDMFVIAARPSMGKTSLLMNIVEHVAVDLRKPCLVFSCEMPSIQLVERLVFSRARISKSKLQNGVKANGENIQNFRDATLKIGESPLFIDDTPSISITEVRAKARRRKREDGLALIAIDYLQLMRSHSKQAQNSREREIAEISAGLKALAKELDVPVIVLAQLNRGPESRTGSSLGVPRMSDLRESGAIEQDADMIGLLYRPDYYNRENAEPGAATGEAVLSLAKNRNGPTGDVLMTFQPEFMRFSLRAYEEPH